VKPKAAAPVVAVFNPAVSFLAKPVIFTAPAIAERLPKMAILKESFPRPLVAAVAEKPAFPVASPPPHRQFTEFEYESFLEQSATTVGLDIKQAEELLEKLRPSFVQGTRRVSVNRDVKQAEEALDNLRPSKPVTPTINRPTDPEETVRSMLGEAALKELPFADRQTCELDQNEARHLELSSRA
jgi:hypothetical protein